MMNPVAKLFLAQNQMNKSALNNWRILIAVAFYFVAAMVGRQKLKISAKWQKIFPVHCHTNQQELKETQPMINPVLSDT